MAITRKLADDNPADTDVRLRLANGRLGFGRLLSATGRPAEAEAEVREALAITRKLVDDNPSSRYFRTSLAAGHNDLGVLMSTTGRPKEAEIEIRKAMAIRQGLVDGAPDVTEFRESLAWSHHDLSRLLSHAGRTGEALGSSRRAVGIFRGLVASNRARKSYREGLSGGLALRADALRAPVRPDEARAGSEGPSPRPAEDWYDLACGHAELAGTADSSRPDTPAGEGMAEANAAIEALRRAVAAGYRDVGAIAKETASTRTRSRPDFRLVLMDMAFPVDPFAPTTLRLRMSRDVTKSRGRDGGRRPLQPRHLLRGQLHREGGDGVVQVVRLGRADDRRRRRRACRAARPARPAPGARPAPRRPRRRASTTARSASSVRA